MFDLDDTLYDERDFVFSGFDAVAEFIEKRTGINTAEQLKECFDAGVRDVFGVVLDGLSLNIEKKTLIDLHRSHLPILQLTSEVEGLLEHLRANGHQIGIITDGRSVTQRNKIGKLGLDRWVDVILISEETGADKYSPMSFLKMTTCLNGTSFAYVGDNPTKDFAVPNRLGWQTVCVQAKPTNIHAQDVESVLPEFRPRYIVERLA